MPAARERSPAAPSVVEEDRHLSSVPDRLWWVGVVGWVALSWWVGVVSTRLWVGVAGGGLLVAWGSVGCVRLPCRSGGVAASVAGRPVWQRICVVSAAMIPNWRNAQCCDTGVLRWWPVWWGR